MFNAKQKLEVTQDELVVIEAALHTQIKILSVQASAGGSGARRRLNEVKRVLARAAQHKKAVDKANDPNSFGWCGWARTSN